MAERAVDKRLEELRNAGIPIYSISRLNTIHQCPYQCYLNYIKGVKVPIGNTWAALGGKVHDALEATIHGADESVVKKAIKEELDDLDLLGVDFPLDRNGNPTIRNNWIANMNMFADNYKTLEGTYETEQLVLLPVNSGKQYMQGYIDIIKHNDDGSVDIMDWKTSSQFDKDHLLSAGRQLVLYGMAMEELGYKINALRWVMLKYCETSWVLKNGKTKTKVSEWRKMISDLKSPIEKALQDLGYDEVDIDSYMLEGIEKNSWDIFPQEIQNKFHTTLYIRDYDYTEENKNETLEYLVTSIESYESRGDNEENWETCDIAKNSFFCASLCDFGGKTGLCKHWVDFCDQFNEEDNDEDLF